MAKYIYKLTVCLNTYQFQCEYSSGFNNTLTHTSHNMPHFICLLFTVGSLRTRKFLCCLWFIFGALNKTRFVVFYAIINTRLKRSALLCARQTPSFGCQSRKLFKHGRHPTNTRTPRSHKHRERERAEKGTKGWFLFNCPCVRRACVLKCVACPWRGKWWGWRP